jgi:MFS transporter, DHA1 family, tetracycline resistance protein
MTPLVTSAEQDQLQGALSSLMSIAGLFAPAIFTLTLAAFIGAHRDWQLPGGRSCSALCCCSPPRCSVDG